MKVTYTLGQFSEIEISGNEVEWVAFAIALEQGAAAIDCEAVEDPSPYSHCSRMIRIAPRRGTKVRFCVVSGDSLIIEGDPELLQKLAQTAANFGQDFKVGEHIHIDFQGEDHFIGQDSIPVVFAHS